MAKALLHHDGRGDAGLLPASLERLQSFLRPDLRTLETGAGHSTVLFARAGCTHTAVTPRADEIANIRRYAAELGVPLDRVTFCQGLSQDVLPTLPGPFDLVLVDGSHAYPLPQIDFFYSWRLLAVGGVLVLDDVPLWPVHPVADFLRHDPDWTHLGTVMGQTAFFRLERPYRHLEWNQHPFTAQRSRMGLALFQMRRMLDHVRHGRWGVLASAAQKRLAHR